MGWITPNVTWTPEPIYNADLNRIEGNLKYLREETATFNGLKSFSGGLSITGGVLNARPNTDTTHTIGRGKMGAIGVNQVFYMSHYGFFSSDTFNLAFDNAGNTFVNASINKGIYLRSNNINVATFLGSAISLLKPVTISDNVEGIANTKLFISGSGNINNYGGAIEFSHISNTCQQGRIYSGLNFYNTSGGAKGSLVLGSYYQGWKDELKLFNGTVTVSGNLAMDNGLADGGNISLRSSGFAPWSIDNSSETLRMYRGSSDIAMTLSGSAISLLKPVAISGALTCSTMKVGASGSVITEMKWL